MKLPRNISQTRGKSGMLLMECMVYIAVFAILLGGATAAFYFCWDHTRAVVFATDDIASALHAGERWRADVRAATGPITVETNATGEVIRIPEGAGIISYRFESDEVRRRISTSDYQELLLSKVKASQMQMDARGAVSAWRWELELLPRRKETHLPLLFTFEAAQLKR
jgi:Tfp pilus assembly protein FimT